ncbi:uncharacterized protein LOC113500601 isoform X1 [Trichoplusia ni]|uniref:Uncharacterized protein LOC113500601 isoform X1 n=1 Tax=Trichoplusia ni TaxID=7111 RepID=A0A7E5W9D2_TRINI|nr:uncharacterized protein LOC113500601 isoform X1 [Trichoplusia ni]
MPNTRRRRFSVQNEIAGRDAKLQNGLQSSHSDSDSEIKVMTNNFVATKSSKTKHKMYPNSSKNSTLEIVAECESASSVMTVKKRSTSTMDKDVTASSSNIDLFNMLTATEELSADRIKGPVSTTIEPLKKRDDRQLNRERTPLRRDKHPRQHRIKVRSPKRRMPIIEQNKAVDTNRRNTATGAINWEQEYEIYSSENVTNIIDTTEDEERTSTHSLDDMCRICHGGDALSPELGRLISACSCRGTVGRVHVKCLERWLTESGKSRCELCGTRYATRRVHRYGVPRALVMWVLSQNAKQTFLDLQLMVDSLGIMLMSPLAVLAAWLSGRTLAGLMTQESHVTPWPLASTFVLACMTLVCYYCWIVSAATRHALGWWIWYRSQYEVRLQLQDSEE